MKRNIFDSQCLFIAQSITYHVTDDIFLNLPIYTLSTHPQPGWLDLLQSYNTRYGTPTDLGGHALSMGAFGTLGYVYYNADQRVLELLEVGLHSTNGPIANNAFGAAWYTND